MSNRKKYHENEMDEDYERPEWEWIIRRSQDKRLLKELSKE